MIFLIFERSIHRPKNLTADREIAFIFFGFSFRDEDSAALFKKSGLNSSLFFGMIHFMNTRNSVYVGFSNIFPNPKKEV